jgi:hypoxanthine-guanine phosphoribosyltransferase
MTPQEARRVLAEADLICSAQESALAVRRVAAEIGQRLGNANPLVLSVMGGAVVFTGQLLPQLDFPLEFDYLHVTRYGNVTTGGELEWIVKPRSAVAGRVVLVVDDILDEGVTMAEVLAQARCSAPCSQTRILAAPSRWWPTSSAFACPIGMSSATAWTSKVPGATCPPSMR